MERCTKRILKINVGGGLSAAVHDLNIVKTRELYSPTTTYKVMYGWKPHLRFLRKFGCLCWYKLKSKESDKLDSKAQEAVMVGYARGSRGYKVCNEEDRKIVQSLDIVFDEVVSSVQIKK